MKVKIPHKLGFTKTTAVLVLTAALAISLVVGFSLYRNHQPNISANAVQTSTTTTTSPPAQTTTSSSASIAAASSSTTTSVNTSVDQTCQDG